jgi:hypothetical protein
LSDRWNVLKSDKGNLNSILAATRESMEKAAKAAGLTEYESLSDEELIELLPEADSKYFKMIQSLSNGTFEEVFGTDVDNAKKLFEQLGLLAPSATDSSSTSLMTEIHELLAGLTEDELTELGSSIEGLE